ncbi:MAG: PQQ-dependent dehydrogenase, methanol/ethanol family [Bryobacteraceae bacterium]
MRFWILALIALPVFSQAETPHAAAVEKGRSLYVKMCSGCHGENAKGGRGPDLTSGAWRWGGSDDDILRNIVKGIAGTSMPPFPIGDSDGRLIVAFLRSLSAKGDDTVHGDAAAGGRLFDQKCARCHMFHGQGGRLGPDLSAITEQMKPGELRKAINTPSESINPGFQTVEVRRVDGSVLRGVKRNEDTFSVQLMDSREKLHLLVKKNLGEVKRADTSVMPALKLEAQQVDDLIAHLRTKPARDFSRWMPSADLNVTYERLKNAPGEPGNWLTYWGDFRGTHSTRLNQISPANVGGLRSAWAYQYGGPRNESTPIVVDGLMFVTGPNNDAAALDARTGRTIWQYRRRTPDDVHSFCTVMTNRGFAVLGDRLYMATLDTSLVALDAKTGNKIWEVAVDDYHKGFSITHAPLAIDGKIIVGVTSGECGLNGFIDAYDATTGEKLWRVWAVAQEGDPARKTWSGKSAETGGAPTWMTGTYDVETDTLFWTTGNPAPDYDGTVRLGDNLYACSVLALDPKTGRMKWYFQFTPHDTHDWDANETPVLIDAVFRGKPRKLLIQANRNGFYYALDRLTGEFLLGKPFVKVTWAKGLDDKGRPIVIPNTDPTPEGNYTCPDASGGANWSAPSYDSKTGLFFVSVREACATYFSKSKEPIPGQPYTGSGQQEDPRVGGGGAIRAIDPLTGDIRWNFPLFIGNVSAGVLSTASGVVFGASGDGYVFALDARTGKELWHYQTGAQIRNSPVAYSVDGKQYIAIGSDAALFTFALP